MKIGLNLNLVIEFETNFLFYIDESIIQKFQPLDISIKAQKYRSQDDGFQNPYQLFLQICMCPCLIVFSMAILKQRNMC